MTDIVERLRKASVYEEYKAILSNLGDEAADEIERLRERCEALQGQVKSGSDEIERLREALIDATVHLTGAASAYRKHGARHKSQGRAVADTMFSTRVVDFEKATDRARHALEGPDRRESS
jgi:predicted  nucleic acid-binding Zn-ribbon protein